MNARVERFNQTIQQDFVDYHNGLLFDLEKFNTKLVDRLVFYNSRQVHHAFNNRLSPLQYLLEYEKLPKECKSTGGHTRDIQGVYKKGYFLIHCR